MDITGIGIVLILGGAIMSLLPVSPFSAVIAAMDTGSPIFRYICWLIPIPEILAIMEVWLAAIATLQAVIIAARWIKLVGD